MPSNLTPELRKILGNTGWIIADRIVRLGVGLFVGVWVARYLGPAHYGSLNFALSYVALFGALATLGLDGIVIREIVRDEQQAPGLLGSTLVLKLAGSFVAVLVLILVIQFLVPHDRTDMILVSIVSMGIVFQAFDTIDSYFQSQVLSKLSVWAKNGALLLVAGLRIFLIQIKAPVWTFAAAASAEMALCAIGLIIAYRMHGGSLLRWHASRKTSLQLLHDGWPLIFSVMAVMVYMRIDMIMLKVMQGETAAGIYAAATKISEIWYIIPVAIVSSVAPGIMRSRDNPQLYYGRLKALFSAMILMSVSLGAVIALASPWIIDLLFTSSYRQAGPVLAVHVWSSVFIFVGFAQGPWDISENYLKLALGRRVAGAIANVLLNLVLIPRYSALGAAVATVVSYAIPSVIGNAFDSRTRPILLLQLQSIKPDFRSLVTIFREPVS